MVKRIQPPLVKVFNKYRSTFVWLLVFAALGTITLIFSHAAANTASLEAEANGTGLTAPAEVQVDTTASSGQYVWFNPGAPIGNQAMFTESFSSLNHWTLANWGIEGNNVKQSSSTTATIENGHVVIRDADQNYGEATLRSDRMYDLRNGGTVSFDVSLGDGNIPATGARIGFPVVEFIDQPLNAPSYYEDNNGNGTGPRNGGYYQFWSTCALPWQAGHAQQFINYVETIQPGEESCLGQVSMAEGQLNRVELRYDGNSHWELWASNVGTTAPLVKLRAFTMQIPEVGYFLISSANHASIKYSDLRIDRLHPTADATFDNISYPAADGYTATFHNGANVVKGAATTAHVVFDGYTSDVNRTFTVTINGTVLPVSPIFYEGQAYPAGVEVPMSLVHDGANTITVQGFDLVFNLDLVLTRSTP